MYALNIDPLNPKGNPSTAELSQLGVEIVRYTFKDYSAGGQPDPNQVRFYTQKIQDFGEAEIDSLIILTYETYPNKPPLSAPDAQWDAYITRFAQRAGQLAKILAPWRPAFQIWNEPDLPPQDEFGTTLREVVYGRLLRRTYDAIKTVDSTLPVVGAGLTARDLTWLDKVIQSQNGQLAQDAIALHPYEQRPEPNWPTPDWKYGYVGDLIELYQQAGDWPIWITEIGTNLPNDVEAEYLRRFYQTIITEYSDSVEEVFWFCYSDGMVPPFGLLDSAGQPKPAYDAYRQLAAQPVALERLHYFAQYLEQNITFGQTDPTIQQQMETELKGVKQTLSKRRIRHLSERMLASSPFSLSSQEIDSLYALPGPKDLYGTLRAIVLATHQRTGALTGRVGPHTRISAESEPNAATNIAVVLQVLSRVQSGNRMIVMDMVKASADEDKLLAPDIFESEVYGQLRNGLVDNHAWNLQKLVRAIRDQGYQERVLLLIRLDGPDEGANVNPFNPTSLAKYELAIAKFIRYLETMLPAVPFKLVLGNEPDLFHERPWSDPQLDPREFTLTQFAPAFGAFMKKLAHQRPDVTLICPALSANLKHDYLDYYTALFGLERPENLVPAMHGYSVDVAALPAAQLNFLEQQAEVLRTAGQFRHVSGTEIGSGNPFGDTESLSEQGRFDDVVSWILLSRNYVTPPGQDNQWNFRIDPGVDDPTARQLADVVNRSKNRVLRNIRERSGAGLQILQGHGPDRPAYAVEYVDHNTPAVMVAGQTQAVRITIRNTSYRTWLAGGSHPFRLGYHWYTSSGDEVSASLWTDHRTQLPNDLLPDQRVTLTANLGAPRVPGTYEVRWDMVEELVTWFAWQGVPTLNVPMTVNPEVIPPEPGGLRLSASHNNRQQGTDNLQQAIDDNPVTRWSSLEPQKPGMWFQIDLGEARPVSQVGLTTDPSPRDYPRGYRVNVSLDGQNWATVAENAQNDRPLNVAFSPRPVRFIRIEQTGSDPIYWWSIHEVNLSGEARISVRASHNNVLTGADNLLQALDSRPDTRWSSRALQQPGMWFEIDLNEVRAVNGLTLDTAGSPNDYPRGYIVRLSTDQAQWQEVARNDRNTQALDVTFTARPARYIGIEQTGSADRWWWSIHEVKVKFDPSASLLSVKASHNNVLTGADNLLQALDGRPDTRWSSWSLQRPGMWFEIDLNEVRAVSGLALDTAGSPNDYPRGYIIRLSTDHNQWEEVARNDRNDRALDVTFTPRLARYIRIEQTGSADRWWWSIHQISIKD